MKTVFVLFCLLLGNLTYAALEPNVDVAYNGCVKFLKQSKNQQKATCEKAKISLTSALNSCHLLVRQGLAKDRQLQNEYNRVERENEQEGNSRGADRTGITTCTGSICSGPDGTTSCSGSVCSNPRGITTCTGSVCSGPDGITSCTGSVCSGPQGITTCSGSVCSGPDAGAVCGTGLACQD